MTTIINCDQCAYEDIIKHAKKWCSTCEEGFCEDCEKVHRCTKISRNHNLISISDYRNVRHVSISQTCIEHGKIYDLYCSMHNIALCIDCVDQHKTCSKLLSLVKASENAKQSTALDDLEHTVNGALQNVGKFIKDEKRNTEQFEVQEKLIKTNIKETRQNLNTHIDFLEQQLILNLSEKTFTCKSAYFKNLSQWNLVDQNIRKLTEEIERMKKMASDVQVFLGTREINNKVSAEIQFIISIISNTQHFGINLTINPTITSLLDCINQFGIISVVGKTHELPFRDAKLDHHHQHMVVAV